MIMSLLSVTTSMADIDFLVSFLQGLWLAKMQNCSILVAMDGFFVLQVVFT